MYFAYVYVFQSFWMGRKITTSSQSFAVCRPKTRKQSAPLQNINFFTDGNNWEISSQWKQQKNYLQRCVFLPSNGSKTLGVILPLGSVAPCAWHSCTLRPYSLVVLADQEHDADGPRAVHLRRGELARQGHLLHLGQHDPARRGRGVSTVDRHL